MAFGRVKDRRARHMTRHRTTALLGVAAAMLLTTGTLAVGSPAYAADKIQVSTLPLGTFTPGQTQTLQVVVKVDRDPDAKTPAKVAVAVTGLDGDFSVDNPDCGVPCILTFAESDTKTAKFPIKARGDLPPGQNRSATGQVTATNGFDSDRTTFQAQIKGPDQAQTVTQVSGVVKDKNGKAIPNATVAMLDGGSCSATGSRCETATNNKGEYNFKPKGDKPIVPGTITVGASKPGFEITSQTGEGKAGQPLVINITMKGGAEATPSAEASDEVLPTPTDAPTTEAPAGNQTNASKSSDSGPSAFSWVIVALAGLLVLLGVGVIVMMLINRRKNDADEDGGPEGAGPGGPGGPGGGPGVYGGETAMHGLGGAPTVVGGPQLPNGPGDAATAIIQAQRPEDEFPDPYNAYPASPGGYQPASGGYDPNPGTYGGAQTQQYGGNGGYPQQQGGYDPYAQPQQQPPATQHWSGGNGYPPPQQGGYDPYAQPQQPPATQHWGGQQQQPPPATQQWNGQQGGYGQEQPPPARDPYYDEHSHQAPPADQRSLGWLDD
jgi:hypothetical protein